MMKSRLQLHKLNTQMIPQSLNLLLMEDSLLILPIHLFVDLTGRHMIMLITNMNMREQLEVMVSHGLLTCQQTSLIEEDQVLLQNMVSRNISILLKLSTVLQVLITDTQLANKIFHKLIMKVTMLLQALISNMHLLILMMKMNEEYFMIFS